MKNLLSVILSNARHPRVWIYIAVGILVISLTFLTQSNAMEIAISAIASVFIGIGVNNFSALETHDKDVKAEELSSHKVMAIMEKMEARIVVLEKQMASADPLVAAELTDIRMMLMVCKNIIEMK